MSEENTPRDDDGQFGPRLIRRLIIVVVLIAVIGGVAIFYRHDESHKPGATEPPPAAGPMPVTVVQVSRRDVPWTLRYLGQTESSQRVEIRSRVRGYLDKRLFEEGQRVKRGDVLFQIDPRPFQAELAQTEAALASAIARFDLANTQLQRYEELKLSGAATSNELQEWQKEQRVSEADVKLNEARVEQARLDLSYTTILAPLDGIAGESLKDVGSYIDDGANGLLTVVRQIDPIYVRFSLSEQDMLRWQRLAYDGGISVDKFSDLELEITLSDGRTFPHTGRINFVDLQVDPGTGTTVVRGTVPNPDRTLLPGQFVHASIKGVDRLNVIAIPQGAVLQTPTGQLAYVVDAEGKVSSRVLTTSDWSGKNWIVEKGIEPNDLVIIDNVQKLQPGMLVAPTVASEASVEPATTQPADAQTALFSNDASARR